jgi:hypothetical protein
MSRRRDLEFQSDWVELTSRGFSAILAPVQRENHYQSTLWNGATCGRSYFALNVLLTPTNSAVQQAVTAVWSVAAITALGFSGLLLANAK